MDIKDKEYNKFEIVKEMFETIDIVRNFNDKSLNFVATEIDASKKFLLTGEGSSRIFPTKRFIEFVLQNGFDINVFTEGASQSLEYDLAGSTVIGLSNSGKTKEVANLFNKIDKNNNVDLISIVGKDKTPLVELAKHSLILSCGREKAVAATKSVIEQALIIDVLFRKILKLEMPNFKELAKEIENALNIDISKNIVSKLKDADIVYFAGRNNGVAEELVLKTNEITRKRAVFLEGTYALHGIEEVMTPKDALVLIDPFQDEEETLRKCLQKGVGVSIFSITDKESIFETIKIPEMQYYNTFLQLIAAWNLLINIGIELGVDIDKPFRARKIGNEI